MARDGSGFYQLPPLNPVEPGLIIRSDWANTTMEDLKNEITDSLSRSGKGGMYAALRGPDGSAGTPTFSFTYEPSTGRFRDGPGQIVESVLGKPVVRYLSTGLEQWDDSVPGWVPLTPRDALGTPFEPASSNLDATNVQDAIQEVNDKTGGVITADSVSYDYARVPVYFVAPTVQLAIDRIATDLPGLANDIIDNADAIAIIDIDLGLLTQRVAINEGDIGDNSNDTQINTNTINNELRPDITTNREDISDIKLEQITQNSNIQGNFDYVDAVYLITQDNADDIQANYQTGLTNAAGIGTNLDYIVDLYGRDTATNARIDDNDTDIYNIQQKNISQDGVLAGHDSRISSNYDDIVFTFGIADGNATDINGLTSRVGVNETDIGVNQQDLANFGSIFPNGFLLTANGGSGTTQRTGTGALVAQVGPALANAYLDAGCTSYTQSTGTDNGTIATTEFVKNQGYGKGDTFFQAGYANSARWAASRKDSYTTWRVWQWGSKTLTSHPGTYVALPLGNLEGSTNYIPQLTSYVVGVLGTDSAPGVYSRTNNGFNGVSNNWNTGWTHHATASVNLAFLSLADQSGHRYYNPALGNEHIELFHGPWQDTPGVIELDPGNVFFTAALTPDELIEYDGGNLPIGIIARVKPPEEIIWNALNAVNLNRRTLDHAMLANIRGNTAPLTAFNAALDVVIGAIPYSEAQILGVI
jgi:hypothetical protein